MPEPKEKMLFCGLRIQPSLKARIERAAKRCGEGFAEWIRNAILKRLGDRGNE
jgi:hypothetical protein